ncbi:MAG: ParB/RepB/Spo0J family partition protein [Planctomycetota bacterium]|nr:MAG: ParB/RepB/Spo0J family partition protein [Planctomycetota bacterium]
MATTSQLLNDVSRNLDESMGVRSTDLRTPLSPVPSPKDAGRRRRRDAGRIEIDRVIPDPEQPRTEFNDDALRRLAASIRAKGQLMAIRIRWSDLHSKWIIVSGERRWRAARLAGLKTIDCVFHDDDLSEAEVLEQQLVENLLREDLRPIEEARGFAALMELHDWNGKQVAEALHLPASKVSRSLALLDLPPDVQERVEAGELASRSAYELTKLPDESSRRRLADDVTRKGMTQTETARTVRQQQGSRRKSNRRSAHPKVDFWAENKCLVSVSSKEAITYHDVKEALQQALEETETRIRSNIQIL